MTKNDFFQELRPLAVPRIYRQNPFQVFRLPISAEIQEFNKQKKKFEFIIENEENLPQPDKPIIYLSTSLNKESLDAAFILIQDPRLRVVQEFFWVWPEQNVDLPSKQIGKEALRQQVKFWNKQYKEVQDGLSLHNLTILYHALALEEELDIIEGVNITPDYESIEKLWNKCYRNYYRLYDNEVFWEIFANKIEAKNEPALSSHFVEDIKENLFQFLYLIHSRLAIEYITKDQGIQAERQFNIIKFIKLDEREKEETIFEEVDIYSKRINANCNEIENRIDEDPIHADLLIKNLLENTGKELFILNSSLSISSLRLIQIHDAILRVCIKGIEKFYNETENIVKIRELLSKLDNIAINQNQKNKIIEFSNQINKYQNSGNFWHAPDYFNQPPEVLSILEKARVECKEMHVDEAIKILTTFIKKSTYLPTDTQTCFKMALSYCYTLKGIEYFDYAKSIVDNGNDITKAIQWNSETKQLQYGKCSACKAPLLYGRYVIVIDNKEFLVCLTCFQAFKTKENKLSIQLQTILGNSLDALNTALFLNPNNRVASELSEVIVKIAQNLNIKLYHPKILFQFPDIPTELPKQKSSDSVKESSQVNMHKDDNKNTDIIREGHKSGKWKISEFINIPSTFYSIFAVSFVIFLIAILFITSVNNNSQPTIPINNSKGQTVVPTINMESIPESVLIPTTTKMSTSSLPEQTMYTTEIPSIPNSNSILNIAWKENYLFIADPTKGLRIFDLTDIFSLKEISILTLPGNPNNIVIKGNLAYITALDSGLIIVDISDPKSPVKVGDYKAASIAKAIFIQDNYAYLADGLTGIHILDITNPTRPYRIGNFDIQGEYFDLVGYKNNLFVANGWAGLLVLDISNISMPQPIGSYQLLSSSKGITTDGHFVYIAEASDGLSVLDISQLNTPQLLKTYNLKSLSSVFGEALDVTLYDNNLIIIDNLHNFLIIDISEPNKQAIPSPEIETILHYVSNLYNSDNNLYGTNSGIKPQQAIDNNQFATGCTRVYVNIRQGPDTSYPVLDVIPTDQCFSILGRNSDATWLFIQFAKNGGFLSGWVKAADYILIEGVVSTVDIPIYPTP